MGKTYYIFSSGRLRRKDNTLEVVNKEHSRSIPLEDVEMINIYGEVDLNTKVVTFLAKKGIVVNIYDYYGNFSACIFPRKQLLSGDVIIRQVEHYLEKEKRMFLAKKFVWGAIRNLNKNLSSYDLEMELNDYKDKLERCRSISEIMSIEGNFRKKYYELLDDSVLRDPFKIIKRTRMPPENYFNTLLSFGNSLLYGVVIKEIYSTPLDPTVSYLHEPFYRRYSLALDIAEIFKPVIVDRVIFKLINKGMIKEKHFEKGFEGTLLNEQGKKLFLREFDEKLKSTIYHKNLKKRVSYQSLVKLECYKVVKHLIGLKRYEPFVMWW